MRRRQAKRNYSGRRAWWKALNKRMRSVEQRLRSVESHQRVQREIQRMRAERALKEPLSQIRPKGRWRRF